MPGQPKKFSVLLAGVVSRRVDRCPSLFCIPEPCRTIAADALPGVKSVLREAQTRLWQGILDTARGAACPPSLPTADGLRLAMD
jgi:hypothetical protein